MMPHRADEIVFLSGLLADCAVPIGVHLADVGFPWRCLPSDVRSNLGGRGVQLAIAAASVGLVVAAVSLLSL